VLGVDKFSAQWNALIREVLYVFEGAVCEDELPFCTLEREIAYDIDSR